MDFILDFLVIVWMMFGLMCTLLPKMPGALIIFLGAMFYGLITGFAKFTMWTILTLLGLVIVSEVGGRILRQRLTSGYPFSPEFGSNTTVGNVGGIIASDALLGILGLLIWQIAVGKNLLPRWDTVGRILVRSSAAALLRFICGAAMILLFLFLVILEIM